MKLHEFTTEFRDLISIVSADKHLNTAGKVEHHGRTS